MYLLKKLTIAQAVVMLSVMIPVGLAGCSGSESTGGTDGSSSSATTSSSSGAGGGSSSTTTSSSSGTGEGQVCGDGVWIVDPQGETVKDTMTGLTWQHGTSFDSAPHGLDWAGAKAYCAGLEVAGGGWKFPTLDQLKTLLLATEEPEGCFINRCAFFSVSTCTELGDGYPFPGFWSSTLGADDPSVAWVVKFAFSFPPDTYNVQSLYEVRCVR